MPGSFFPAYDNELLAWAIHYKDTIVDYTTAFGMTPEEVAEEIADCDAIIEAIKNINTVKGLLHAAKENRDTVIASRGSHLRAKISQHKTSLQYTTAIGENLKIVQHIPVVDFSTYKANLRAELFAGHIRIRFFKRGVDGINLYYRKKESGDWILVSRITVSPFDHLFPLETSHQVEHIEYRAYGVVKDQEVGIASDIVEILYGG
jgi:hypothetical protein